MGLAESVYNRALTILNLSAFGASKFNTVAALCVRQVAHLLAAKAEGPHPFPSRTRKLSPPALMVLGHEPWESRSLPDPILEKPRGLRGFLLPQNYVFRAHPTPKRGAARS